MSLLRWIVGLIFALAAVLFAVANTAQVQVVWNPLTPATPVPLAIVCLAALSTGFVAGGLAVWVNGARARRDSRLQRKQIRDLEQRLIVANENHQKDREKTLNLMIEDKR